MAREVAACLALSRDRAEEEARINAVVRVQARARLAALGEMAAGVALEINGPLAIVRRTSDQMERAVKSGRPDEVRLNAWLSTIDSMTQRMARAVRSLLLFAREDDSEELRLSSVREIIDHAAALCHGRFLHHGVVLQVAAIDPALTFECQPAHMTEALINLLNNAFVAALSSPEAWVNVHCSSDATHVEIAISDSGDGVDQALRDKIMRPFFTTKPVGEGMGLGLSIAFGIVSRHHGQLWLDETSPRTRFVLRVPRTQSALQAVG
jgi:two-component system sensor histidine kinase DctS